MSELERVNDLLKQQLHEEQKRIEQLQKRIEQLQQQLQAEQREREAVEAEVGSLRLSVRSYHDVLRTIESDSAFVEVGGGLWLNPSTGQQLRVEETNGFRTHILGHESTPEEAEHALKLLQGAGKAKGKQP